MQIELPLKTPILSLLPSRYLTEDIRQKANIQARFQVVNDIKIDMSSMKDRMIGKIDK